MRKDRQKKKGKEINKKIRTKIDNVVLKKKNQSLPIIENWRF